MNIVVTVPKSEQSNVKKEEQYADKSIKEGSNVAQYWQLSKKPKALQAGDKVYFVENGYIRYYHTFFKYTENAKCDVTNRVWNGINLVLDYPPVKLDKPIFMKGFQGFRYLNF